MKIKASKRRFASLAIAALVSVPLTAGLVAPAHASEANLDDAFVADVTSVWSAYGVSAEQQAQLLSTLATGGLVDAVAESAAPTRVEDIETATDITTVQHFADGSINLMVIEKPQDVDTASTTRDVSACTKNGTTWTNCNVNGWYTGVALAFFANMNVGSPSIGQPAVINKWWSPTVKCTALSCSTPTFELIRQTQSGTAPAMLNLVTTWSALIGSGTTRLSLQVKNGTANVY